MFVFPRILLEFADECGTVPKIDVALTLIHNKDANQFSLPFDFLNGDVMVDLTSDRFDRFKPYFQLDSSSLACSPRCVTIWRQYYNISERLAIITMGPPSDHLGISFYRDGALALTLAMTPFEGKFTLNMNMKQALLNCLYTHTLYMVQKCNSRFGRMLYAMYESEGADQWTRPYEKDKAKSDASMDQAPPLKRQKLHVLPTPLEEQRETLVTVTGPDDAVRQLFSHVYRSHVDEHMVSHCTGKNTYVLPFLSKSSVVAGAPITSTTSQSNKSATHSHWNGLDELARAASAEALTF